jgi:hypothetical protein
MPRVQTRIPSSLAGWRLLNPVSSRKLEARQSGIRINYGPRDTVATRVAHSSRRRGAVWDREDRTTPTKSHGPMWTRILSIRCKTGRPRTRGWRQRRTCSLIQTRPTPSYTTNTSERITTRTKAGWLRSLTKWGELRSWGQNG